MSKLEFPDRLLAKRMALSVNQEKCSVTRQGEAVAEEKTGKPVPPRRQRKIWIDLDNTPHVPFFLPIIEQLRKQGYEVFLTAPGPDQQEPQPPFHHTPRKVFADQ